MVSLVENQRSCFVSMAYWKQALANERMLDSLLCSPWKTAGPSTFWTRTVCSLPDTPRKVMVHSPGSPVAKLTDLYTSP